MKTIIDKTPDIGKLIILVSLLLLVPLSILVWYPQDMKYMWAFLIPSFCSMIIGLLACSYQKPASEAGHSIHCGSKTVLFIWLYSFILGAVPFVLGGQLTMMQAVFESVSGWTTTGLSTMDVRVVPKIFLFYRSFMQYCGGLGFVLMMVMIIQNKRSMSLYQAEGHNDQLVPHLAHTARTIFLMYIVYLGIGTLLYIIFGMSRFDAINHAMSALSTGGFSTQYDSIGAYQSMEIEAVTIFLMLIGTTNFAVLLLLSKRKFKQAFKVSELKFLFWLLVISVPLVAASLVSTSYLGIEEGVRAAFFNIVSALSTSGFSTNSYVQWPPFSIGMLILMMVIGGGIGSTAGGLKLSRVYLVGRIMLENIKKRITSSRTVSKPYYYRAQGKTFIDQQLESETLHFVLIYLMLFIGGSLLLSLTANASLTDAMFEFASCLSTVGLSIGITGPNTNSMTLFVEILGMLLGRLEIYIVIISVYSMIHTVQNYFKNIKFMKRSTLFDSLKI